MSRSIIEYFYREKEGYKCGYCKNEESRFSNGMWGHVLTSRDYQDLIDRGWRRSGQYCYKPINRRCCCPMYTIRCAATQFKISRSQKKTLRKFKNYIENDKVPGGSSGGQPATGRDLLAAECPEAALDERMSAAQDRLALQHPQDVRLKDVISDVEAPSRQEKRSSTSGEAGVVAAVPSPSGTQASQLKAKLFRRERWKRKQQEKGMSVECEARGNEAKELEDWLRYRADGRHTFQLRLLPADPSDPSFMESFEESLTVYQKYQVAVHGDALDKCSATQYKRFLCKNPIVRDGLHGAFHRQYIIDGRIVAVGVIDILPYCVSSVYLYYDPEFAFLSLGTYTSLSEIGLVRELNSISPNLKFYYLGFYIHSCQKMKYKGQFSPSFLCCPESYSWEPLESCQPLLDSSPYSRLNPNLPATDLNSFKSINDVLVLFCGQMLDWQAYLQVREEGPEVEQAEIEEVTEYGDLVGKHVVARMLLYRPQ